MTYSTRLLFCYLSLVMLLVVSSCDVQQDAVESGNGERIITHNNAEALSERLTMVNKPITGTGRYKSTNYMHVADARPLDLNGERLSATAIHIKGDYAFVSYHLHGKAYGGAIDVIDISDPSNPQIVSNMTFADTDLNDITINVDGTYAYVAGGRKLSSSGYEKEGHNGAIAAEIRIENNSELTDDTREVALDSYSGNSIEISGNNFVVSTGGTGGGAFLLDQSSFSVQRSVQRDLARHVDIEGEDAVAMAINAVPDSTTKLYRFNRSTEVTDSIDTGLLVSPVDGKNVIDYRNQTVYAALSNRGFKAYEFSSGSAPVATFDYDGSGLANGLDASDEHLYMAAGKNGLYIAKLPNLDQVFHWDDDEQGSANYVESDGEYIFLGKGMDGLNILHKSTPQPTACPFDGNDGTVIELKNNRIYSNADESQSQTDSENVDLSSGTYTVKLFGYDDHRNDSYDRTQQNQPNESFYVSLRKGGNEVAKTEALGDLPDDSDLGTREKTIDDFQLKSDVDEIIGIHAVYPDNGSANSLNAKCVAFKKK